MKIGLYLCKCGNNISEKIDYERIKTEMSKEVYIEEVNLACSEDGKQQIELSLRENNIERMVIVACSPREHEHTFMKVMENAGLNPYLMQMVNAREQIAWVTEEVEKATEKALRHIRGAIKRVSLHEPLDKKEVSICPNVLILGAGPAGLKAALALASAGRKVFLVEKSPVIGGMPVRYEELFPNLECGPCMLEPMLGEVLHGEYSQNIELYTLSELVEVTGFFGNFVVKIKKRPRYVDSSCVGCGECVAVCPVSAPNEFNFGMNLRKAIDFPFAGALPNVPFIDDKTCLKFNNQDCRLCIEACPLGEDVFRFDEKVEIFERQVGAIVLAIGANLFDCSQIPNLGYGKEKDVLNALEFERMLASNGPTAGEIKTSKGKSPQKIAIIHCVGSLDERYVEYCSGICCSYAFKFNHMISQKLPEAEIYHFYKELVIPGKENIMIFNHAKHNPKTHFIRYDNIDALEITSSTNGEIILRVKTEELEGEFLFDLIILCPAMVPIKDTEELGRILEATQDRYGFFEELHNRLDAVQSKIKGIYLAGTCQSPMDIQKAISQGVAVAGYILSNLVEGRKFEIKPIVAQVSDRCSGCKICVSLCPYKALFFDEKLGRTVVNEVLCQGCGTCVSACPAGAAVSKHFTTEQILAEIEGVLR